MDSLVWVLATKNQGKVAELQRLLVPHGVKVRSLADCGINASSPETCTTFAGNARQKAEFYHQQCGLPVLSDDSGLAVDALAGAPGVHSARFGGLSSDAAKNSRVLELLQSVPTDQRGAHFHCAAVFWDGTRLLESAGRLNGLIGNLPRGEGGFGYDPIFYLAPDGPSLAELSREEKNRISHRGKAFKALLAQVLPPTEP